MQEFIHTGFKTAEDWNEKSVRPLFTADGATEQAERSVGDAVENATGGEETAAPGSPTSTIKAGHAQTDRSKLADTADARLRNYVTGLTEQAIEGAPNMMSLPRMHFYIGEARNSTQASELEKLGNHIEIVSTTANQMLKLMLNSIKDGSEFNSPIQRVTWNLYMLWWLWGLQ